MRVQVGYDFRHYLSIKDALNEIQFWPFHSWHKPFPVRPCLVTMTKCIPGMKCQFGVKPGKTEVCTPHDKRRAINTLLCTFFSLPNPCLRLISQFGLRLTASAKKKAERRKKKNRGKIPLSKWEDVGSPNFVKKRRLAKDLSIVFVLCGRRWWDCQKQTQNVKSRLFFL